MPSRPPKFRPEAWLASLALIAICVISLGNVIVRYTTDASFAFTEEFSVFLPAALKGLFVVQWLVGVSVMGVTTWYGAIFAMQEYEWESLSPGLGLPNWIYVIWLPLMSAAIIFRMTQNFIDRLHGKKDAEVIHES